MMYDEEFIHFEFHCYNWPCMGKHDLEVACEENEFYTADTFYHVLWNP